MSASMEGTSSPVEGTPSPAEAPQPQEPVCWICLETSSAGNPLVQPCACPRPCHLACLSRWQLQSAGKSEETNCRFCQQSLPHWSESLAKPEPEEVVKKPSHIIMGIKFKGKTYKVKFEEGVVGAEKFKQEVRRVLQLPESVDIDANFIVCHPQTGERLTLSGFRTYEAAAQLAAMNAAKRCQRLAESPRARSRTQQAADGPSTSEAAQVPLVQRMAQGVKQFIKTGGGCILFGK